MNIPDFYLEPASYEIDFADIQQVRNAVFVVEQQIPADCEFDDLDRQCFHLIVRDLRYQPIATARMTAQGKIGRMAVLKQWRGQGIGRSLLSTLIEKARRLELTEVTASAQLAALGFYEKMGFGKQGDVFDEAGIAHQTVRLQLQRIEPPESTVSQPVEPIVAAMRLDSIVATQEAFLQLLGRAHRQVSIYSRDLEYAVYGHKQIAESLKQFALSNRNSQIQVIIHNPANLQSQSHPVLELAQRLSSFVQIRTPLEDEDLQYTAAYACNDRGGYLFRPLAGRYEGHWSPNLPAQNLPLCEEFERVWQRSRVCSEFRALGI